MDGDQLLDKRGSSVFPVHAVNPALAALQTAYRPVMARVSATRHCSSL
jgi:hypothetical protein